MLLLQAALRGAVKAKKRRRFGVCKAASHASRMPAARSSLDMAEHCIDEVLATRYLRGTRHERGCRRCKKSFLDAEIALGDQERTRRDDAMAISIWFSRPSNAVGLDAPSQCTLEELFCTVDLFCRTLLSGPSLLLPFDAGIEVLQHELQ